ncbi:MAG TPA: hypothetical protein VFH33_09120 [Candidatus Krumholzibacteria bacterium]|nr:hypothetical protein [Candidatus Krumholzibacteria bacterium]
MVRIFRDERGTAMVTTLFFIIGLTVAAAVIAMVTTSEKRVAHNDYTHSRSYYSSDAGSESAINWLRLRNEPPTIVDVATKAVVKQNQYTDIDVPNHTEENKFKYDTIYDRPRFRPGFSKEYRDLDYTINAEGASVSKSSSLVEVQVSRLFKLEY